MKKLFVAVAVLFLSLFTAANAQAQLNSSQTIALNLNVSVNESLTISCTPSAVNFVGSVGTITGDNPVSCTHTWTLNATTRTKLTQYVFTASPNALTGPTGGFILPASVSANIDGAGFKPCNSSDPFGTTDCGGGTSLATSNSAATLWPSGTINTTIALEITLSQGQPVGAYTGVLTIIDQAV